MDFVSLVQQLDDFPTTSTDDRQPQLRSPEAEDNGHFEDRFAEHVFVELRPMGQCSAGNDLCSDGVTPSASFASLSSTDFCKPSSSHSDSDKLTDNDYAAYYYRIEDPHQSLIDKTLQELDNAECWQKNIDRLLEEELISVSQAEIVNKERERTRENIQNFLAANRKREMFNCFLCGRSYYEENLMRKHIQDVHLERTKGTLKCSFCGRLFSHRQHLNRHVRDQHTSVAGYRCHKCPARYATKSTLVTHLSREHGLDEAGIPIITNTALQCKRCGKETNGQIEMKRHENYCLRKEDIARRKKEKKQQLLEESISIRTPVSSPDSVGSILSPNGRPRLDKSCPFCGLLCASMQSRNRHIERKHPEKKDEKGATDKVYIKVDSPNLPFGCSECGKRFASSSTLSQHRRRIHEGDLPHQCHICSKRYPLAAELRKHLRRVHSRFEDEADYSGATPKKAKVEAGAVDDMFEM